MKNRLTSILLIALVVLFSALAVVQSPKTYYPLIEIDVPSERTPAAPSAFATADVLSLTLLFDARPTLQICEGLTGNVVRVALAKCPNCSVRELQCLQELNPTQKAILSERPLNMPSGRMYSGVVTFTAANPVLAESACQQSQIQAAGGSQPVTCYPPNTLRPRPIAKSLDMSQIGFSLLVAFAAAFGSCLVCWLIVKYEHLHAHFSHDQTNAGPQKFHAVPTPRIGGLGLIAGLLAAGGAMMLTESLPNSREYGLLLVAAMPAIIGGLVEDITKKVGVLERLFLTMMSGTVAAWLIGAVINRLEISGVDSILLWLPIAVVFTAFAVGGIANAINIIDGYNGLAGGFGIIVLVTFAYVAQLVGDSLVFIVATALIGALLGFLVWNWPSGKLFLGDGGAFLLGFLLAELSVLLVSRNPEVSPWFPMLLLTYPVFETLFSVYRKMYLRGHSPSRPDGLHLHMLIYKRVVPREAHDKGSFTQLDRNNRVSKYLLAPAAIFAFVAGIFWQSTIVLVLAVVTFCVFYVFCYRRIVKWKSAVSR